MSRKLSHSDVTEHTGDARAKLDTLRLAAYAGRLLGPVNLAGPLGYAYDSTASTPPFASLGAAQDCGHGPTFTPAALPQRRRIRNVCIGKFVSEGEAYN